MRQDITDLQALYDGRYSCEENVYRGGLWDNEQEEYETGERELRRSPLIQAEAKEVVSKEGIRGMVNAERTMGSGGLFSSD